MPMKSVRVFFYIKFFNFSNTNELEHLPFISSAAFFSSLALNFKIFTHQAPSSLGVGLSVMPPMHADRFRTRSVQSPIGSVAICVTAAFVAASPYPEAHVVL